VPPCFLTNFPKVGTHLMRHILGMRLDESLLIGIEVGRENNALVMQRCRLYPTGISGHILPIPELLAFAQEVPSFLLLRNPRDTIVSWHHWLDKAIRGSRLTWAEDGVLNYKDFEGDARKDVLIENLYVSMEEFAPWLETDIIVIHYESILETPEKALAPVAEAIGADLDVLVEKSRFRGGKTFRKGVAGEWKHEFTKKQLSRIDELYGHIMEAWGYD